MYEITSSKNRIFQELKDLDRKKYRIEYKKAVIEGIKMVSEAFSNKVFVDKVIVSCDFYKKNKAKVLELDKMTNVYKFKNYLFEKISSTENPQGILSIVEIKNKKINFKKEHSKVIILENIQDPGNIGNIIRTADAFLIDGIIISSDSVDIYNKKVLRSTMGSIFRIPILKSNSIVEEINKLKEYGYTIYCTNISGESIQNINKYHNKSAIIFGNESRGISDICKDISHHSISIPMNKNTESLNVSAAAAVIIYDVVRRTSLIT